MKFQKRSKVTFKMVAALLFVETLLIIDMIAKRHVPLLLILMLKLNLKGSLYQVQFGFLFSI